MLRPVFFTACTLLFFNYLPAQNQPPVLSNLTATVDWNFNTLTLQYDVSDPENDPLEVTVFLSDNGGKSYDLTSLITASGDVGFPVTPGASRSIVCDVSMLATLMNTYTVRVVADDKQDFDLQALVNEVDSNRIHNDLAFVEGVRHRSTGPVHLQAMRDSLSNLFNDSGLYTEEHTFPYGTYTGRNILGSLQGTSNAEKVVVVDAHYDTVANAPGADDNGSGTVGVMEIARLLSRYPSKKTLRFIGFDLEESGLLGSIAYVTNGIPNGEQIDGVFNFEMIGYYSDQPNSQQLPAGFDLLFPVAYYEVTNNQSRGDFIANIGNTNSQPLATIFKDAATQYVPDLKVITLDVPGNGQIAPDFRRSDHTPFWEAGDQALMLTDGANFRNMSYHTPQDVFENKLSFTFMSNVVKATLAAAAELAEIQHGDWASASFQNIVGTKAPQPCELQAYVTGEQRDLLHLQAGDCVYSNLSFELYDAKGALITQQSATVLPLSTETVWIPELKPGVYTLRLNHRDGARSQLIIVP